MTGPRIGVIKLGVWMYTKWIKDWSINNWMNEWAARPWYTHNTALIKRIWYCVLQPTIMRLSTGCDLSRAEYDCMEEACDILIMSASRWEQRIELIPSSTTDAIHRRCRPRLVRRYTDLPVCGGGQRWDKRTDGRTDDHGSSCATWPLRPYTDSTATFDVGRAAANLRTIN